VRLDFDIPFIKLRDAGWKDIQKKIPPKEVEVSKFCDRFWSYFDAFHYWHWCWMGTDTRILLQTFLVGIRDHFGDTERGTAMYKVFSNTLVATSWNAFAGDIAVKSRDAIKLHQEKYNANSVIPHIVLASDYLTDCHQALFFQQDTLVY